jgi:copper homeostasis protein
LTQLKSLINIPVFVMIRPHSKSFCYDQESFEVMKSTLTTMKHLGADGFVFGILRDPDESFSKNTSSWIDVARNKELIELAEGKPCTFHRAFDCIPESYWDTALADLIRCGFASILTSGGPSSDRAIDCVDRLANLAHRLDRLMIRSLVNHKPLQIIVGGGVRSDNIRILGEKSQARAFHSSARVSSSETVAISEVRMLRAMLQADSLQPYSTAPNET